MAEFSAEDQEYVKLEKPLRQIKLSASQIRMIDEALSQVGEFGEVRLVVERGRLRFLVTEKSFDVLKWESGSTDKSGKELGR